MKQNTHFPRTIINSVVPTADQFSKDYTMSKRIKKKY